MAVLKKVVSEDSLTSRYYSLTRARPCCKVRQFLILISAMGNAEVKEKPAVMNVSAAGDGAATQNKPLKPCCACPETKRARDECIMENGEENCSELIEAHKACMRKLGFNV